MQKLEQEPSDVGRSPEAGDNGRHADHGSRTAIPSEVGFRKIAESRIQDSGNIPDRRPDPCLSLQGFLLLDLLARLFIWSTSIVLTTMFFSSLGLWPSQTLTGSTIVVVWEWSLTLAGWIILYNMIYVAELVILRLPIPTPRQGVYSMINPPDIRTSDGRQLICACLIALLTKARYEAPFPGFLVFHISNIPPMRWLMGRIFGPKSRSCYVTDPIILDPHLVEIGRNVVIGSGANIAGHCQLPDLLAIRKTIIEDDVVIGANTTIFGGVRIRCGAMVAAGSVVAPFTQIGECEYWSGVPAVKLRDMPPPQHLKSICGNKYFATSRSST